MKCNLRLTVLVGLYTMAALLTETFLPQVIFPHLDRPCMALLSCAALISARDCENWKNILLAGLTFSLLPWCAGIAEAPLWQLFLQGALIYAAASVLYGMTAGETRIAAALNAGILYLALRCL